DILSVFNFVPVLAFPVPVQEVREACADVADGSEDVIIMSGKRAEEGEDPSSGYHGSTQASLGPGSMLVQSLTSSQDLAGSPSTSNYASGVHQKMTNLIQLPSSTSGRTGLPWYSSGGMQRPLYASGRTELSWYSSDDTGHDGVQLVQPGTMSKIPSISSVRTKTSTNRWMAGSSVRTKTAKSRWKAGSSVRTKTDKWVPMTETEPALSSSGQITPVSSSKDLLLSEQITPTSSSKDLSPSEQVTPASLSKDLLLSEQEGYLAQTPMNQLKPPSQSKSFWGNLASKSKSFVSKLASISKSLVSELVDNPKLQLRSSTTAAGGAVNAAQSELQGMVHTEAYISTSFLSHKHSDLMVFLSVTL
ncbi:hypothetical protein F5888DRAFT_1825122, partial [Russula emetica]